MNCPDFSSDCLNITPSCSSSLVKQRGSIFLRLYVSQSTGGLAPTFDGFRRAARYGLVSFSLVGFLSLKGLAAEYPQPNLKDMQIAARVLGFQEIPPSGAVTLALVYDATDVQSHSEATAIAGLLGTGLTVAGLVLRPLLVEQTHLATTTGYDAVFTAVGVNEKILARSLEQRKILCLTRHLEQVEHGVCTVSIRSLPSVNIALSGANATSSGVHFATAFRMMVREL